jgi:hypothetical protein
MREISAEQLKEILSEHELWLDRKDSGQVANSPRTNLPFANLPLANPPFANLPFVNPPFANLPFANLPLS